MPDACLPVTFRKVTVTAVGQISSLAGNRFLTVAARIGAAGRSVRPATVRERLPGGRLFGGAGNGYRSKRRQQGFWLAPGDAIMGFQTKAPISARKGLL